MFETNSILKVVYVYVAAVSIPPKYQHHLSTPKLLMIYQTLHEATVSQMDKLENVSILEKHKFKRA